MEMKIKHRCDTNDMKEKRVIDNVLVVRIDRKRKTCCTHAQ